MNNQCQTNVKAHHKLITQRSETQKSKFVLSKEGHPKGSIETKFFAHIYLCLQSFENLLCALVFLDLFHEQDLINLEEIETKKFPPYNFPQVEGKPTTGYASAVFVTTSLLRSISLRSVTPYGMSLNTLQRAAEKVMR